MLKQNTLKTINKSDLLFSENTTKNGKNDIPKEDNNNWKLMVIDDDEAVHQVTRMVLEDLVFEDRGLSIVEGYSGKDAQRLLRDHPDTAVLLLDVVMESDNAGLEVVRFIREQLNNKHIRIILRTGQPGEAPEKKVITEYDINDYKGKSDLTADKLHTSVVAALRAFKDLHTIENLALSKVNLEERINERTEEILKINQSLAQEIEQREQVNNELQQSESRLARAQLIANVGHWEWDIQTKEVTWSNQIYRILGIKPNSIPASFEALLNAVIDEEQKTVRTLFTQLLNHNAERYDFEHAIYDVDGKLRFIHQQGEIIRDSDGNALKLSGVLQDISEHRLADEKMRKLSGAIEQIADSVMITDIQGKVEYVNSSFEKMTGYTSHEIVGNKPSILKSEKQSKSFYQRMWRTIIRGEVFFDVVINRKKDGELYYEEKTITPQKDKSGNITHFISTGKDISERMESQERLHYLAHHDSLTGLPNRALFQDRLSQVITRTRWHKRNIAVLFLDLDRFKVINDSLGHDVGDQVLQTMAQRLSDSIREGDTVARLGGDEFAIILNDIASQEDVAPVAEKILKTMAEPFVANNHELFITTSIGASLYPKDSEDTQGLLKKSDVAMYRAKEKGKNNFQFYTKADDTQAAERLTLETNLRHALEREEFFLEYQPQYAVNNTIPMGVEALIRWRSAEFKTISPLHFIPLLEETGMIIPVSDWVLNNACAQAAIWQESGLPPCHVAVNLSSRQFQRQGLVKQVEDILNRTGLRPEYLELEVTEGLLIENISETTKILNDLHDLGVRLSIDDFGTGYSSMNYLKRLPFDNLKIDKSFVQDVTISDDASAIATAIITLAHSLDMKVIAEGVETSEQLKFLQQQNCDMVQGFLFSKPVSPENIQKLLNP